MSDNLNDSTKQTVDDTFGAGTSDKAEGKLREELGRGKEAVGAVTGDDELRAEGLKDQAAGKAQGILGELKEGVEKLVEKIDDAIHGNHTHHDE